MIDRTKEEIEEFVANNVGDSDYAGSFDRRDGEVGATPYDGGWRISVKQMYNYVNVDFAFLLKLSEFFDTKEINDERYSSSGCESCDYGSSYEVVLTVK